MRKQTLVSSLTIRFTSAELAVGRMPIFKRRSNAGTSQIISARLSKNGPMATFASDTSLPRPRDTVGSEGVAAVWSGFCARFLGFVTETALVSLRTLAFFLPLVTDIFSPFNLSILHHCS